MVGTTVVLCAHGSRAPGIVEAQDALCAQLAAELDLPVVPGFLEINEPGIPAAIDLAVSGGAREVLLLPYFLHAGNHTTRDIPAIVAAAAARHPGVEIRVASQLGPDPRLVAICADRARSMLGGAQTPSSPASRSASSALATRWESTRPLSE